MRTIIEQANYIVKNSCNFPNSEEDNYDAGYNHGLHNGFLEGVEFAQRWIPVE